MWLFNTKLHADEYTVGVAVNDTINEPFAYSTPCTYGSLEFVLEETLIPYVTGLTFQVEFTEINGLVLSDVIDTIRTGDKIMLPVSNETGTLQITLPVGDDSFTFITTISGTPQIAGETYHCSLSWAITEAVCHNAFYIYVEDTLWCAVQPASGLDHHPIKPVDFVLCQNYPNPFNHSTMIRYHLYRSGFVNLCIYNLAGQQIEPLANGYQPTGVYKIIWTAKGLPTGLYFYQIKIDEQVTTKKLILQK